MSSSSGAANNTSVYVIFAVLVVLVIRRIMMVVRGSKVSKGRTIAFSIYYFAFAGILISTSFLNGATVIDLALYIVVGIIGGVGSYIVSKRRIVFWKGADGSIYFKGAIVVYLVYLVGLITRILIDLVLIGPQAFAFGSASSTTLSSTAVDAEILADCLLALSAGLLTGRNARIMKRYSAILRGEEKVPDSPQPIPPL
jgi:hypothetical protein